LGYSSDGKLETTAFGYIVDMLFKKFLSLKSEMLAFGMADVIAPNLPTFARKLCEATFCGNPSVARSICRKPAWQIELLVMPPALATSLRISGRPLSPRRHDI